MFPVIFLSQTTNAEEPLRCLEIQEHNVFSSLVTQISRHVADYALIAEKICLATESRSLD